MDEEKPEYAEMQSQEATQAEETPQATSANANTGTQDGELIQIIGENLPDADVSTPEAVLKSATELVKGLMVFQNKVRDLASNYPDLAAFLYDLIETGSKEVAFAQNFDADELQAFIDEVKSIEYEEHRSKYQEKNTQRKNREQELNGYSSSSQMSCEKFLEESNIPDDELDEFIEFFKSFQKDMTDFNLTFERWNGLWKLFKHDDTVADLENKATEAEENGKIMGRNEKIITGKKSRAEMMAEMPEMGSGAAMPAKEKPKSYAEKFMEDI